MATHGKRRHLKRLAAPKAMSIMRKGARYLKKPSAGRHKLTESVPLLVLLRDELKLAADRREAKAILSKGRVLVDGKKVTDEGFAMGLMDVVSLPLLGKHYRIVLTNGRLKPKEITETEAAGKLCRITGKKLVKGGRMQLEFHDGRSCMIEREEDRFKLGDTVRLAVPAQKITSFMKMQKGSRCYVFKGKHAGEMAELQETLERAGSTATDARLSGAGGEFATRKDYVFVVDDNFDA
ncbi:MAG: 30S ribosomal protein S4e [Candidatus Micrarchaeota archaeon]